MCSLRLVPAISHHKLQQHLYQQQVLVKTLLFHSYSLEGWQTSSELAVSFGKALQL